MDAFNHNLLVFTSKLKATSQLCFVYTIRALHQVDKLAVIFYEIIINHIHKCSKCWRRSNCLLFNWCVCISLDFNCSFPVLCFFRIGDGGTFLFCYLEKKSGRNTEVLESALILPTAMHLFFTGRAKGLSLAWCIRNSLDPNQEKPS